jgi:hypothetical protein
MSAQHTPGAGVGQVSAQRQIEKAIAAYCDTRGIGEDVSAELLAEHIASATGISGLYNLLVGIGMALDEWDHYDDTERDDWVRLVLPQVRAAIAKQTWDTPDARLIVAAPEMLSALRAAESLLHGLSATDYPCSEELDAVRAAIAEAEGR